MQQSERTHYRACNLCEAICGLEIRTRGPEILSIRGDSQDPVSKGFICPKATALADIHNDPDRLRRPVRKVNNQWQEIGWDEAFELAARSTVSVQAKYGPDSMAFYAGNPSVHNWGNMTHGGLLRKAVGTRNHFSATSLDQLPHHLAALEMYGHQFFLPVPDIDRTQLFVIFGGNPIASNGSMMTMADAPGKFKALRARNGKLVVFDPRRTETAARADQHFFVRPGTDAYVLTALIHELFAGGLVRCDYLRGVLKQLEAVEQSVAEFTPELAEQKSGVRASVIRQLARELSNTERAVVYGRMGVSVQRFGAVCQWAIQVVNILIGAFDREGGTLLTSPAFGLVRKGSPGAGHFDRFRSRVRGLPEFAGELPAVAMAEEILTEGTGQVRGLITIAGNPLRSSAGSKQLTQAVASLDFQLSIDFYVNETTCHADLILPPTSPLEHDHYDIAFLRLAIRNNTRYNLPVFEPPGNALHDWQIFNGLSEKICRLKDQPFQPLPAPETLLEQGIQSGELGPRKNTVVALTLDTIRAAPHGIDLGPLQPGAVDRLCTADDKIDLLPTLYAEDLQRLGKDSFDFELLLIGRRHLRSNNSWLHNSHRLVKGKPRWQLMMNPADLDARNIEDGAPVKIESRSGSITTIVMATDQVMPGVVSLPHGWGHDEPSARLSVASRQGGANCNVLTDDQLLDAASGNAALNGVPVTVSPA